MLKIQTTPLGDQALLVTLSGRVEREYVVELERLVRTAKAQGRSVSFDMADVSLVDREALRFFAGGEGSAAELRRCPNYLRRWFQSEGRGGQTPK